MTLCLSTLPVMTQTNSEDIDVRKEGYHAFVATDEQSEEEQEEVRQ